MGFPRQEYWSGLPFSFPGDLPNPGIEPGSPTLQADALLSEPPGRPCVVQHVNPGNSDGDCSAGVGTGYGITDLEKTFWGSRPSPFPEKASSRSFGWAGTGAEARPLTPVLEPLCYSRLCPTVSLEGISPFPSLQPSGIWHQPLAVLTSLPIYLLTFH